jgi:integrase
MACIRRRGVNTYEIYVYLGRDAEGKRKYYRETFHGTRGEAQRRAAELEVKYRPKVSGPRRAAMTLGEYLEKWLEEMKGTVEERSWETYSWHVRRLKEVCGQLPLYDIAPGVVQEALMRLECAPVSRKKIAATLRTALRRAVVLGYLAEDPTVGVRLPKTPRWRHRALTKEEWDRLLREARRYRHYPALRLLATTGMRLGEVLGLQWRDVDLQRGTVTVRRTVDCRSGAPKEKPKTDAGYRTLELDVETVVLLRELWRKCRAEKVVGLAKLEDRYVFSSSDGRPLREKSVRLTLKRALKRAGLTPARVHDLRHTAGSLLLDAGCSLATVAETLGHADPSVTASIYTHAVRRGANVVKVLDRQRDWQRDWQGGEK